MVAVSQSGETADTLAALREAKRARARAARDLQRARARRSRARPTASLYTHAGPEIGVASTKAFTTQLVALCSARAAARPRARHAARRRGRQAPSQALRALPRLMEQALQLDDRGRASSRARYSRPRDFLFLGRGVNYPIALEGALKLKEISYIHAEGYAAGEMKHGPIALIDEEHAGGGADRRAERRLRQDALERRGGAGARRARDRASPDEGDT